MLSQSRRKEIKNAIISMRGQGIAYGKIAKELGMSINTVKSYCLRHDIRPLGNTEYYESKRSRVLRCDYCGVAITQNPHIKRKRFCSDKCRNTWWKERADLINRKAVYEHRCQHCGKVFYAYGNAHRKYCTHECYIADRFGGGTHVV